MIITLSPWFFPAEPPVRNGRYQVKGWIGQINYREWFNDHWRDEVNYDRIPQHRIRAWRGVVKP